LTFRSLFALENLRRAENLPNGSAVGEDGPQESPKAGRDSAQAPPTDEDSDSSAAPLGERQEEAPKSPNLGRSGTEDSPAVARCK
jgi:hypothetical protein